MHPMSSPKGKIHIIDTVSQNKLNTIKNHEIDEYFNRLQYPRSYESLLGTKFSPRTSSEI